MAYFRSDTGQTLTIDQIRDALRRSDFPGWETANEQTLVAAYSRTAGVTLQPSGGAGGGGTGGGFGGGGGGTGAPSPEGSIFYPDVQLPNISLPGGGAAGTPTLDWMRYLEARRQYDTSLAFQQRQYESQLQANPRDWIQQWYYNRGQTPPGGSAGAVPQPQPYFPDDPTGNNFGRPTDPALTWGITGHDPQGMPIFGPPPGSGQPRQPGGGGGASGILPGDKQLGGGGSALQPIPSEGININDQLAKANPEFQRAGTDPYGMPIMAPPPGSTQPRQGSLPVPPWLQAIASGISLPNVGSGPSGGGGQQAPFVPSAGAEPPPGYQTWLSMQNAPPGGPVPQIYFSPEQQQQFAQYQQQQQQQGGQGGSGGGPGSPFQAPGGLPTVMPWQTNAVQWQDFAPNEREGAYGYWSGLGFNPADVNQYIQQTKPLASSVPSGGVARWAF